MSNREDYFARVVPLLGRGLADETLAVERLSLTGRVVEQLVGCLLHRVIVRDPYEPATWPLTTLCRGQPTAAADTAAVWLAGYLAWKNPFAPLEWLNDGTPAATLSARLLLPGSRPFVEWNSTQRRVTMHVVAGDLWSYESVAYAVARELRDLLLGRRPWPEGRRSFGSTAWPFGENATASSAPEPEQVDLAGKHLLVVGLGSVGSEVLRRLAGRGCRWTLVDDGSVSVFNPHRQWFGGDEIGQRKVEALAGRLAPEPVQREPWRLHGGELPRFAALLDRDRPDAVLLTTGTSDDGPLAAELWRRRLPHLAAYAYPQARFFEVSVVLPAAGTPCLDCLRGHLYAGAEPSPPMSDEVARFLYREPDADKREQAFRDLVAEPATPIETNRLATVVAQTAVQLLAPPGQHSRWFERLLSHQTTCLLGGNVVEQTGPESFAYGISQAGQIVRLGLEDLVGAEARRVCPTCARRLDTRFALELPRADDEDQDRALLA